MTVLIIISWGSNITVVIAHKAKGELWLPGEQGFGREGGMEQLTSISDEQEYETAGAGGGMMHHSQVSTLPEEDLA